MVELMLKWTVIVNLCDPPSKADNARFTTVPFKLCLNKYQLNKYVCFCFHLWFLCKRELCISCLWETTNILSEFDTFSTLILHILIRLRFQRYRCKSGIGIFVCRVTWNYTYWPFNARSLIFSICWTVDPEILNPNLPSVLIYTMILRSKVY